MNSIGENASGKLHNLIQTFIILAAMSALFGLLGWMIFGIAGIIWSLVMVGVLLATTPKLTPAMVLRMYHARPLTPGEVPGLYRLVSGLSSKAGLEAVPRLYYIPTKVMNAFSVGSGSNFDIALSDGLIRYLNARELEGVMAHEISHIMNNDLKLHTFADMMTRITSLFSFFGQVLLIFYLPMVLLSDVHVPLVFIFLLIFAPTLSVFLQLALSRTREFDADLSAVKLTGDPEGLASALQKMDNFEKNLLDIFILPGRKNPHPSVLRTHPYTAKRIERIMKAGPHADRTFPGHNGGIVLPDHIPEIRRMPRSHWLRPWH
ncbi:MAG TPA: zinc metalloprotease HtpX [Deltaproteobacteria bacterium]|jgi:heat shock protein HtpX|nr:zinc metalloprotease HtpX [Deltaproteobacteria bacterium]